MTGEDAYLNIEYSDNLLRIGIAGEVDHHSARQLREKIDGLLVRYRPTLLVLDLDGVCFMDSSGLGLILGRLESAREVGCRLELTNVGERVMKILSLAGAKRISTLAITPKAVRQDETDKEKGR